MTRRLTVLIASGLLGLTLGACKEKEKQKIPLPPAPSSVEPAAEARDASAAPEDKPADPHAGLNLTKSDPHAGLNMPKSDPHAGIPGMSSKDAPKPSDEPAGAAAPVAAANDPTLNTVTIGGYVMEIPKTWDSQPTANPMRVAQFEWPAASGSAEKPQGVVFFFGVGSGGGVQSNLDRWRGQFVDDAARGEGAVDKFSSPHAKITLLDQAGTYKLQPQMMSPDFTPKPDWQMLAAVVEIERGPYFFRVAGPKTAVSAQKDALIAALKSFRKAPTP